MIEVSIKNDYYEIKLIKIQIPVFQLYLLTATHEYFLGNNYLFWLVIVVTAYLYNAFGIPLRSTYPYQTDQNLVYWLFADYTADMINLMDMLLVKPRLRFMQDGIAIVSSNIL